jgi:hypothetical protein
LSPVAPRIAAGVLICNSVIGTGARDAAALNADSCLRETHMKDALPVVALLGPRAGVETAVVALPSNGWSTDWSACKQAVLRFGRCLIS